MSRVIVHRLTVPVPPVLSKPFEFAALRNFRDHPVSENRHLVTHDRTGFIFSYANGHGPRQSFRVLPRLLLLELAYFLRRCPFCISSVSLRHDPKISYTACLSRQYSSTLTILWITSSRTLRRPKPASVLAHPQSSNCRLPLVTSLRLLSPHPLPSER